jgi:Soluble lytic murein transglycosylase and related regulatory proteins (some contain LysM/invasin domains)
MQLMPSTASFYASQLPDRPSVSRRSLRDPALSVRLGATMFTDLRERFGCDVVAAAAYNAGPRWAERWTEATPVRDVDVWLERVTYPNGRRYARDVATTRALYELTSGRATDLRCTVR